MIIVTKSADRKHFSTALNAFKANSFRTEQNLQTRIGIAQWSGGVTKPIPSFSHITIFLAFWETFRYVMMENQCFV